jgi:chemotaxis family two-component system response regulator Rcp1
MGNSWIRPVEILLVEDDPLSSYLMEKCLREARVNNRVSCANDGQEAIDFLTRMPPHEKAPRPDLVFLDLHMPRKNGFEVLAQIKADPTLKRIPVIVLTSSCAQSNVNAVYDLHANCYLRKTTDLDELCRQIRLIEEFWFSMALWPNADPVGVASER